MHCPILETNNVEDLDHILGQSALPVIICDSSFTEKLVEATKRVKTLKHVVCLSTTGNFVSRCLIESEEFDLGSSLNRMNESVVIDFCDLVLLGKYLFVNGKAVDDEKLTKRKPEDIVSIIYTSGFETYKKFEKLETFSTL